MTFLTAGIRAGRACYAFCKKWDWEADGRLWPLLSFITAYSLVFSKKKEDASGIDIVHRCHIHIQNGQYCGKTIWTNCDSSSPVFEELALAFCLRTLCSRPKSSRRQEN